MNQFHPDCDKNGLDFWCQQYRSHLNNRSSSPIQPIHLNIYHSTNYSSRHKVENEMLYTPHVTEQGCFSKQSSAHDKGPHTAFRVRCWLPRSLYRGQLKQKILRMIFLNVIKAYRLPSGSSHTDHSDQLSNLQQSSKSKQLLVPMTGTSGISHRSSPARVI